LRTPLLLVTLTLLFSSTLLQSQETGKIKVVRFRALSAGYLYGEHFRNELNVYDVREMLPESNAFRKALAANRVVFAPSFPSTKGHSEFFLSATFDPYNPGRGDFCRYFQLQLGLNLLSGISYSPAEPYSVTVEHTAPTHYHTYNDTWGNPDSSLCYRDTVETHDFSYTLDSRFVAVELAAFFHSSYENRFQFGAGFGMAVTRGLGTSLDLSHTEIYQMKHEYSKQDQFGNPQQVQETTAISTTENPETVKLKFKGTRFFLPFEASARLTNSGKHKLFFFTRGVIGVEKFSAVVYNSTNRYYKIGAGLRLQF
jgi:hypothetical protein